MSLYFELLGGLGDAILRIYFTGNAWYGALDKMNSLESAVVAIMSHNPDVAELLKWHPKRKQIGILDLGFTTPFHPWEDEQWRIAHGLPPVAIGAPHDPVETLTFYPSPEDQPLLEEMRKKKFIVMGAQSSVDDRTIPANIRVECARLAVRQGYEVLVVGSAFYSKGSSPYRFPIMDGVIDATDRLTVPGLCEAVKLAAGSICAHSAVLHMAWSERKPVFLLYNQFIKNTFPPAEAGWYMQGVNRKNTDHMEFSEYKLERFLRWLNVLSLPPDLEHLEVLPMNPLLATLILAQIVNPFEAEIKKAEAKLVENAEDPGANLVAGKYHLFAGDIDKATPFLIKGSDASLKAAAKAGPEADQKNALVNLEVGDLWTQAIPKNKPVRQACLDRASFWYAKAWPDLGDFYKMKLKERLAKLYAPVTPGRAGALPAQWGGPVDPSLKTEVITSVSHSGGTCVRMTAIPKAANKSLLRGPSISYRQGAVEFYAWVLSDGTDSNDDAILVHFNDENKKWLGAKIIPIKKDLPVWMRIGGVVDVPDKVAFMHVEVILASSKGFVLLDDVQLKIDGKLVVDQGFEGK